MKLLLASILALGSPVTPAEGVILAAENPIPNSYVVVLREGASAQQVADRYGGTVDRVFTRALNGFEVRMSSKAAHRLAADRSVAYVQQNGMFTADLGVMGTQPSPPSWALDRIDQRNLPLDNSYTYPNTASNVHAYILSTGIRTTHTDFGGRAIHGWDVVDNDGDATDCNGHGTAVAGTTGGTAHGAAKGVRLVAVRMLNCAGSASTAQVVAGVEWVTANAVKPAVAVLVAGGPTMPAYDAAVRNSIASGVTYVVIAGSSNSNACSFSPGGVTEAITIGATTNTDARHSATNFGTCLDLFSPGVGIVTTWHTSDTAVTNISGTSFATGYAGGVAAMILSAHPTWTPLQVRNQLVADATPGVVTNPGTGSPNLLLYVNNSLGPAPCIGTNGNNVSIPDSPGAAVTSSIAIAGCSGNASATSAAEVHIIHPFRGDLQIDLIAPDGTVRRLQSTSADSGDDIHTTYVVNLSTEVRNGVWVLRVRDRRVNNTGFIDSWTLTL